MNELGRQRAPSTPSRQSRPVDQLRAVGGRRLAEHAPEQGDEGAGRRIAQGAVVVVDNVAQFRGDLRPVVERLSRAPYRSTLLPFRSGTLVGVYGGA